MYRLFVLNRGWKRVYLQIMIFVYDSSTWDIVELKMRFESWITWNDLNGVGLFHLSYVISHIAYLFSQRTPHVKGEYFMFDWSIYTRFVLNRRWKHDYLEIVVMVNVCSQRSIVELKTLFETSITSYDVNGVSLVHFSHLIILMAYLCSQWTPNVQINYFIFVLSIDRLFVLNRAWKTISLQIMIFVHVCTTYDIVELKTRFVTWIAWNDVNGVIFLTFLI
jgi:hypothetical protein